MYISKYLYVVHESTRFLTQHTSTIGRIVCSVLQRVAVVAVQDNTTCCISSQSDKRGHVCQCVAECCSCCSLRLQHVSQHTINRQYRPYVAALCIILQRVAASCSCCSLRLENVSQQSTLRHYRPQVTKCCRVLHLLSVKLQRVPRNTTHDAPATHATCCSVLQWLQSAHKTCVTTRDAPTTHATSCTVLQRLAVVAVID